MTATRGDMLAEMASDMERSDTDAFTSKINAAIRHYQPKRFWFNESRSVVFTTAASTDTYSFTTIGTTFYRIDRAVITIAAGDVRDLEAKDYSFIEACADEDTTTGEPSICAYVADSLRLFRNPDDAYAVRLLGHVKLAAPEEDAEVNNAWMTEAYDLIMSRAKAELYAHRYEDPNNAAIMQQAEASALRVLQGATHDKVAPGYLEATEF